MKKEKNIGIRLTGVSIPFGGISWEYTEKKQEYEAINLLFILLEGKRLVTLSFSRSNRIPIEKDMEWCSLSAIDLKDKIFGLLYKYTLQSETKNELQSMIDQCNILIEGITSLASNKVVLNDKRLKRDDYLKLIDNFKKSLFPHIKFLSEKYSIPFKEIDI
ncbi:DUF6650 family protein [Clostridium botulinum]|uniref:DUF6650 family protein n=1 Tax=Clostridium botulinum TaxID=1491 RepID=UPI0030C684AA